MRILHFTDSHLNNIAPISRTDDFANTTINKLIEVGKIADYYKVDLILHSGDLFQSPRCDLFYLGKVARAIRNYSCPMYVVPGNHDLYGQNINTLDRTFLGCLANTGVIHILDRKHPLEITRYNTTYRIEGQEYHPSVDSQKDLLIQDPKTYNILLTHSMLVEKPYVSDYVLIDECNTNANIVLAGHYHPGWKERCVNNTAFFNPGAMVRRDAGRLDIPKVLILEINDSTLQLGYTYVTLQTALPRDAIFDLNKIATAKNTKNSINNFQNNLNSINVTNSTIDVVNVLKKASNDLSAKKEIYSEMIDYINTSQQKVDNFDNTVKGYIATGTNYIKSVDIKNFQSHINTHLDFSTGLNVLEGRSGNGKSSILRAILWCLYNEPKGNGFIRTGEKSCSVKVTFANGNSITRKRSKTSSGTYIIEVNGNKQEYKGFGSDVPIEVTNIHQMPKINLTKDYTDKLNVMNQFDSPFIVSQSPATQAYCIGNIIPGTQVIDVTNKDVLGDITNISKEISILQKTKESKTKELENYNNVEVLLNICDSLNNDFNILCSYNNEYNSLLNLYNKRTNVINTINSITSSLYSYPDITSIENMINNYKSNIEQLTILYDLYIRYNQCINNITTINNNIISLNSALAIYDEEYTNIVNSVNNMYEFINKLYKLYNLYINVNNVISCITNNINDIQNNIDNYPVFNIDLDNIKRLLQLNALYEKAKNDINVYTDNINQIDTDIDNINKDCILAEKDLENFLSDNGITTCPICGNTLSIEKIIQGEM